MDRHLAIIGTGNVGGAIGRWAARVGYTVVYAHHDLQKAEHAALETGHGATAVPLREVAAQATLILLAVPFASVPEVIRAIEPLHGKILIDVTNPLTPDHRDLAFGHNRSGAEEIERQSAGAQVVKAFNATFAEVYASGNPFIDGKRVTIFYAGNDDDAKRMVARLIEAMGFNAVDAGPLASARYLEPLSMLNIRLGRFLGLGTRIGYHLLQAHPAAIRTDSPVANVRAD